MKHAPPAPGTQQLIAAIDSRIAELDAEGELQYTHLRNLSDQMREFGKRLEEIRDEIKTLDKLRKTYLNNSRPHLERKKRRASKRGTPRERDDDTRPGATETVVNFMLAADGRMMRSEATKRLESAIRAGAVHTRSNDPVKMSGTTIGNLIRTGYLREEGEYVVLLVEGLKRKGRPGT